MAFLTDFPEREISEQYGSFGPYWQPRSKALAASYLITSAISWLRASEQATSMVAIHAVTQAAHDIERAATLLREEPTIAWDAMIIVGRCAEGLKHTAYPWIDGIVESAEALLARIDKIVVGERTMT